MRGKWKSLDFLYLLNEVKEEIANIFKKLFYKEKQTIYRVRKNTYLFIPGFINFFMSNILSIS
jgi:hypothetical protein